MSAITENSYNKMSFTHPRRSASIGIRGRLFLGFAGITLIFMIAIGIALFIISTTKVFTAKVIDVSLPTYDMLLDLNGQIHSTQESMESFYLTDNEKYKTSFNENWDELNVAITSIDNLSKQWNDESQLKKWQEIKVLISNLKLVQDKFFSAILTDNKTTAVTILTNEIAPIIEKIKLSMKTPAKSNGQAIGLLDEKFNQLHEGTSNIIGDLATLQVVEYVLSIFGILSAILIAYITSKGILRHIKTFREHSSRIASGDLTQNLYIESDDEIGLLGNDLNVMTTSLATITKELNEACHNMVSTLEEVRHAVDVQSSGASEQASSINEITASISEIEKSSSQTMEKAKALGDIAERTREKGQLGLEAVEQSIQGMKAVRDKVQMIAQTILDLSNQTQQVGEITSVVNNLAQQSKMLALNASIEAAKAGEAGKGFAVVAVEVKNLAEQSEQSTSQVQKILEDIRQATEKAVMVTEEGTKGVDQGTGLVEQTGEIIRSLNEVIHETTLATQQIEAAIRQESAGIEQITTGMNEINQVTASFVDSSKQTTEAMENLSKISKNLKSHVETYKV